MFSKDLVGGNLGEKGALKDLTGQTPFRITWCVLLGHLWGFSALSVTAFFACDSSSEQPYWIVFCLGVACNCFALIVHCLFDVCGKQSHFFFFTALCQVTELCKKWKIQTQHASGIFKETSTNFGETQSYRLLCPCPAKITQTNPLVIK